MERNELNLHVRAGTNWFCHKLMSQFIRSEETINQAYAHINNIIIMLWLRSGWLWTGKCNYFTISEVSWINCQHVIFGIVWSWLQLMWRQSQVTNATLQSTLYDDSSFPTVQLILLLTCLIARLRNEWAGKAAVSFFCYRFIWADIKQTENCMKNNKHFFFSFLQLAGCKARRRARLYNIAEEPTFHTSCLSWTLGLTGLRHSSEDHLTGNDRRNDISPWSARLWEAINVSSVAAGDRK